MLIIRIISSLTVLFLFHWCLVYFVRAKKLKLNTASLSTHNLMILLLVSLLMLYRFGNYILINGFSVGIVNDPNAMRLSPFFKLTMTWFR